MFSFSLSDQSVVSAQSSVIVGLNVMLYDEKSIIIVCIYTLDQIVISMLDPPGLFDWVQFHRTKNLSCFTFVFHQLYHFLWILYTNLTGRQFDAESPELERKLIAPRGRFQYKKKLKISCEKRAVTFFLKHYMKPFKNE